MESIGEREQAQDEGEYRVRGAGVLDEEAFYTRLREGFNDIFLTLGYDGNADDALVHYRRALEILNGRLGPDHPYVSYVVSFFVIGINRKR